MIQNIKDSLGKIQDFPQKGILFYDICPLMYNPILWQATINKVAKLVARHAPDVIVGLEARGFLLGSPIALQLKKSFVMIRKKNKLPGKVVSYQYNLEYGQDIIEIQEDAIKNGQKVIIIDDVVATSGTMLAAYELIKKCKGNVIAGVSLLEIESLKPRDKITHLFPLDTLIKI